MNTALPVPPNKHGFEAIHYRGEPISDSDLQRFMETTGPILDEAIREDTKILKRPPSREDDLFD